VRGPASAPSYVNESASVPVRAATIAVAIACFPPPAGCRHIIEVVDVQLLVVHCAAPMEIDGDVSAGTKFMPDSESVAPPVVGPFGALKGYGYPVPTNVTTGAARHNRFVP
jgi:hypothetical protein